MPDTGTLEAGRWMASAGASDGCFANQPAGTPGNKDVLQQQQRIEPVGSGSLGLVMTAGTWAAAFEGLALRVDALAVEPWE